MRIEEQLRSAFAGLYELDREIGSGATAVVWLAHDLRHDRRVAIKVLRPEIAALLGTERFLREIQITARLTHAHILPVYDSGQVNGLPYYVMQYAAGKSLRDLLAREQQLALDEAVRITREVAEALSHAHAQGIVHRDIKPENILLSEGHAVVADFGIAHAIDLASDSRLTETGISMGTPTYMSPEQAAGDRNIDGRSDLYALGCVLYEMLAGEPPHTGSSAQAVLRKKITTPIAAASAIREAVPKHLDAALSKLLATTAADRFRTGSELVAALDQPFASTNGSILNARFKKRFAAGATVVALVSGFWWLYTVLQPNPGPELQRVIVFPFQVPDDAELTYMSEGLMDLVSESLDGLGELRRVDPLAVTSYLKRESIQRPISDADAERAAQHFGAGRYVIGKIMNTGNGLRVDASLYRTGRRVDPEARASKQFAEEAFADTSGALTRELVANIRIGDGAWLDSIGSIQPVGFAAYKGYLQGEALLRHGEYAAAVEKLTEVVKLDSTFALAWFRLSVARGWWTPAGNLREALDPAMRHRAQLKLRQRLLLEATYAEAVGEFEDADSINQLITGNYPDVIEAWYQLGHNRAWYGWQRGVPWPEARPALDRALELDPDFREAVGWRMMFALAARDHAKVHGLLPRYPPEAANGTGIVRARATLAFGTADPTAMRAVLSQLDSLTDLQLFAVAIGIAANTDSLGAARRVWLRLAEDDKRDRVNRTMARIFLAGLELAQGRLAGARTELAAARLRPIEAVALLAYLAAVPVNGVPPDSLSGMRVTLQQWDGIINSASVSERLFPVEAGAGMKEYILGLLSARLSDQTGVARYATLLEQARTPTDDLGIRRDFAREVGALYAMETNQPSDALALLNQNVMGISNSFQIVTSAYTRPLTRLLRAQALAQLDSPKAALNWYATNNRTSPRGFEYMWTASVNVAQAEIYEVLGDRARALELYRSSAERWRDAEGPFRKQLEAVRARIARLEQVKQ